MDERRMRELFGFEQGARLVLDTVPGTRSCSAEIRATDTGAALLGLGLLAIRLAQELQVPVETVLGHLAVTVMKIGQELGHDSKEEAAQ